MFASLFHGNRRDSRRTRKRLFSDLEFSQAIARQSMPRINKGVRRRTHRASPRSDRLLRGAAPGNEHAADGRDVSSRPREYREFWKTRKKKHGRALPSGKDLAYPRRAGGRASG